MLLWQSDRYQYIVCIYSDYIVTLQLETVNTDGGAIINWAKQQYSFIKKTPVLAVIFKLSSSSFSVKLLMLKPGLIVITLSNQVIKWNFIIVEWKDSDHSNYIPGCWLICLINRSIYVNLHVICLCPTLSIK